MLDDLVHIRAVHHVILCDSITTSWCFQLKLKHTRLYSNLEKTRRCEKYDPTFRQWQLTKIINFQGLHNCLVRGHHLDFCLSSSTLRSLSPISCFKNAPIVSWVLITCLTVAKSQVRAPKVLMGGSNKYLEIPRNPQTKRRFQHVLMGTWSVYKWGIVQQTRC
jgi:hypothetical protein